MCAQLTLRPGDRAYAKRPRYSVYDMATRLAGGEIVDEPDGARLRYVCSPHNPSGLDGTDDEFAPFGGLLAIDQAYLEFGGVDRSPLVRERDDTVVIRSMSKAFALAGARVGYILAPPRRWPPSWTPSGCPRASPRPRPRWPRWHRKRR